MLTEQEKKNVIAQMASAIAQYEGWDLSPQSVYADNDPKINRWVNLATKCYAATEKAISNTENLEYPDW